jgi:chromosome segregation ATPase
LLLKGNFLDGGLLAVFIVVAGTIANFVYSFSRERKARVNIKAITDESAATVRAANLEAEARAEQQRIQYSDFFFKQTQTLETKLDRVQSESVAKYEKLYSEYITTVTSNAHMQGQIDHLRIEQVESGKRSQMNAQQLGAAQAGLEHAHKQIVVQSQRLTELETELTKTRSSEIKALQAAETYRQELESARADILALRAEYEQLQHKVVLLTDRVSQLESELSHVTAERDRLYRELTEANAQLDAMRNIPTAVTAPFTIDKTSGLHVDETGEIKIGTPPFTTAPFSTTGSIQEATPQ